MDKILYKMGILKDWLIKRAKEEYDSKDYSKAMDFYNEAIGNVEEYATYFSNRAACEMMLNQHAQALKDCKISVSLNNEYVEGYIMLIRCLIELGEIGEAEKNIEIVSKLVCTNPKISTEQSRLSELKATLSNAKLSFENKHYNETISHLGKVIDIAKHSASFRNTIDQENVDAMCIYRKCAVMHHSDPPKEKEKKSKSVGKAVSVKKKCKNSKNGTDADDKNQQPAVLYFKGFPEIHPNSIIQLMLQKTNSIKSIRLQKGKNYGLAYFHDENSAKLALKKPLVIRRDKKPYSIVFRKKL